MTGRDPKYVSSDQPVNRRTAARAAQPPPVNPVVQERMQATLARTRLGPALVEQLRAGAVARARSPTDPVAILGAVVASGATVALFLGWLQDSVRLVFGGLAGLVVAATLLAWRRRRNATVPDLQPAVPLFDQEQLRALDRVLEQIAPEIPEAVALRLTALKNLLVRLEHQAAVTTVDENFTPDDRMYVVECVRRYLPDSLQGYLVVPASQRSAAMLEGGQTAVGLLLSQLDLLQVELERREARMARSAGEALLKQQRFLQAKTRSR